MKKRYIALATGGSLFAMAIAGFAILQADINACNAGDEKVCKELAKTQWDNDLVHQEIGVKGAVFFTEAAKYEKQAKAEAKKASKWEPTPYNISMLSLACENTIKPALKDPHSFRRLDEGMSDLTDNNVTVWVKYSATNSFGGRVQDTHSCTYTR